jgi:hypothetical protein
MIDGRGVRRFISIVRVEQQYIVDVQGGTDPTYCLVRGRGPGETRITLIGDDKLREDYQLIVRHRINVPLGISVSWQWHEQKPIQKIAVDNGKIARVQVDKKEATKVTIEALAEGDTQFTLTDAGGKSESIALRVRKPDRLIAVGETIKLEISTKKPLRIVTIQDGSVLDPVVKSLTGKVTDGGGRTIGDPDSQVMRPIAERKKWDFKDIQLRIRDGTSSSIEFTGASPGLTAVSLFGEDREQSFLIGVKPKK